MRRCAQLDLAGGGHSAQPSDVGSGWGPEALAEMLAARRRNRGRLWPRRRRLTGHPSRCDRACCSKNKSGPKESGGRGEVTSRASRTVGRSRGRGAAGGTRPALQPLGTVGTGTGRPGHRIPGLPTSSLDPEVVLFVLLPPLLWSAGLEACMSTCAATNAPSQCSRWACPWLPRRPSPSSPIRRCRSDPGRRLTLGAIGAARCGIGQRHRPKTGPAAPDHDVDRRREPAQRRDGAHRHKLALQAATARASRQHGLETFRAGRRGRRGRRRGAGGVVTYVRWRLDDATVE